MRAMTSWIKMNTYNKTDAFIFIRRTYERALYENKAFTDHVLTEIQKLNNIERMADEKELCYNVRTAMRL